MFSCFHPASHLALVACPLFSPLSLLFFFFFFFLFPILLVFIVFTLTSIFTPPRAATESTQAPSLLHPSFSSPVPVPAPFARSIALAPILRPIHTRAHVEPRTRAAAALGRGPSAQGARPG